MAAGVLLALSLPALGLVAARARRRGAALLAPGRPRRCGRASGPDGWPGWAATPSGWPGPAPSTGTAPSSLVLVEALFFAAAAAAAPRRGAAGRSAFVGACTLAEARPHDLALRRAPARAACSWARPTAPWSSWPGWAARCSSPPASGPAASRSATLRHGRSGAAARRASAGPSLVGRGRRSPPGSFAAGAWSVRLAPDGGAPVRTLRVAAGPGRGAARRQQGGGPAGLGLSGPAGRHARASPRPTRRPTSSLWPEDVVALDRPLAGSPQADAPVARWPGGCARRSLVGVTEPASPHHLPQRGRGLGARRSHRRRVREGAPGALRRVRARPRPSSRTSPTSSGVPADAVPGTGPGSCARRPAPLGLLVSFEIFYAGRQPPVRARRSRSCSPCPTNTSSYSTSQVPAQEIAAARVQAVADGPRSGPGRPDRATAPSVTPAGRRASSAARSGRRQVAHRPPSRCAAA